MPEISIIVPVYKAEQTLERCVESVLAQTFSDWELILVEDGSPDGSGALCDALAARDARISVLHGAENAGVSVARNRGMDKAAGAYIAFLDSDDWAEPALYGALYQALLDAGADTAGCGHFNVLPAGERTEEAGALPAGVYDGEALRAGLVAPLLRDRVGGPRPPINGFIWRFLFSGALLRGNGLRFSGAYLEDEVFLIEYFCLARRLVMLERPLYCYYFNPASVTRRYLFDFPAVFRASLDAKRALVERYELNYIGGWEINTAWAGLLIGVGNIFAPGNPSTREKRKKELKELVREPAFAAALEYGYPRGAGRNKQLVIDLLHYRMYGLLAMLYEFKNRGRRA